MNFRKVMLVSIFLLAILTISAVSASDGNATSDELTVSEDDIDDELMSVESDDSTALNEAAGENETVASGENPGDEVLKGDSHVSDFYVMYIDTYVINSGSSDVFTLYPNSAVGNLTVHVDGNETPVYNKVFTNTYYYININELGIDSAGFYRLVLSFVPESGDTITLADYTLNVKELSKEDFRLNFKNNVALGSEADFITFGAWNIASGNITVNVGDKPVYNKKYTGSGITLGDLNITATGSYDLLVRFIPESGDAITLIEDTLTVRLLNKSDFNSINFNDNVSIDYDSSIIEIYDWNVPAGNLTVTVNETQVYNEEFMNSAQITLSDLNITSVGSYQLVVSYVQKTGETSTLISDTLLIRLTDADDFNIRFSESKLYDSTSDVISFLGSISPDGNVTVTVNDKPVYNKKYAGSGIKLSDLNISATGSYDLMVRFVPKTGDSLLLLNASLNVKNYTADDFGLKYITDIPISASNAVIRVDIGAYNEDIDGNFTVHIDGSETPIYANYFDYYMMTGWEELDLSDLGIDSVGEYDLLIKFLPKSGGTIILANYTLNVRQLTRQDFISSVTETEIPITSKQYVFWLKYGVDEFELVNGYFSQELYLDGYFTISIGGNNLTAENDDRLYLDDLGITDVGTYNVSVKFTPDVGDEIIFRHFTLNVTAEKTFTKDDFDISFEKSIAVNSHDTVIWVENSLAGGNIIVSVNGSQVVSEEFGEYAAYIDFDTLGITETGIYNISVSYLPNTGESVLLCEYALNVTDSEGYDGVSVLINSLAWYGKELYWEDECLVLVKSSLTGNILVYIDDKLCYNETGPFYTHSGISPDGRQGIGILSDLPNRPSLGEHLVKVKYQEGDNITLVKTQWVTCYPVIYTDSELHINNDNEKISIYIPNDADGHLYVIFEGNEQEVTYNDGDATFYLSTKTLDLNREYTIYLELRNDSFYPRELGELTFTAIPKIIYPPSFMSENETQEISIDLPASYTGKIYLYNAANMYDDRVADEVWGSATLINGKATIPITGLNPGDYLFRFKYENGEYVYESESLILISVQDNMEGIQATMDSDTIEVGDNAEINITAPKTLQDAFNIYLDGELVGEVYVNSNGKVSASVPITTAGRHVIKVLYNEKNNFYSATFNINKQSSGELIDPEMTVSVSDFEVGSTGLVEVTTSPLYSGNVSVEFDSYSYIVVVKGGYGNVTIADIPVGGYTLTATLNQTETFTQSVKNTTFKVTAKKPVPKDPKLTVSTSGIYEGETAVIYVEVDANANGTVTVNINDKDHNVPTLNGKGNLTVSNLTAGYYPIKASFTGDEAFYNVSSSSYLIVSEVETVTLDKEYTSNDDGIIILRFPDDATGTVTVFVNGVMDQVVSIVNGIAVIDLSKYKDGTYLIVFEYSGDRKYAPSTQTSNVVVMHKKASPVPVVKLTLKKVNVKKSAKKLILQATLKINNAPVKAKKITFKFNGKKYTAKTNKKGIAKVTVKKNVLKKLKVGKKIKIQATYLKTTKKLTVKVKK